MAAPMETEAATASGSNSGMEKEIWCRVDEDGWQAVLIPVKRDAVVYKVIRAALQELMLYGTSPGHVMVKFQGNVLKPDAKISEFNTSADNPLLLVLPPEETEGRQVKRPRIEEMVADPKATELMVELQQLEVHDNCLNVQTCPPWLSSPVVIYVRAAYEELHAELNRRSKQQYVVIGNPGIGKSYFALYMLYKALKDKIRVVFQHQRTDRIYYFDPLESKAYEVNDRRACDHLKSISPIIYLFDCATKTPARTLPFKNVVVFSSPNHSNYSDVLKDGALKIYMPVWSMEEIDHLHSKSYSSFPADHVKHYYEVFGGIPRYIFGDSDKEVAKSRQKDLEAYCANFTIDMLYQLGKQQFKEDYSHLLFHLVTTKNDDGSHDYFSYSMDFASQFVAERVYKTPIEREKDDCVHFLRASVDNPLLAVLRGKIFEMKAHECLQEGGSFKIRKLSSGTITTLTLPKSSKKKFRWVEEINANNPDYMMPKSQTFCAVDAILPPDKAFQMTISPKHPLKAKGVNAITQKMKPSSLKIYFVVPSDKFDDFTREQRYEGDVQGRVEQYVLCIDFNCPP